MFRFKQKSEIEQQLARIERSIIEHQTFIRRHNQVINDPNLDEAVEKVEAAWGSIDELDENHPDYKSIPLSKLRALMLALTGLKPRLNNDIQYRIQMIRRLNERRCMLLPELHAQPEPRVWTADDIAHIQDVELLTMDEDQILVRFKNLSVTPFPEKFPELVVPIDDITMKIRSDGSIKADPDSNIHRFYYSGDNTSHPHGMTNVGFCFGDFDSAIDNCTKNNDLPTLLLLLQQFFNTVAPMDDAGKSWALPLLDDHLPDIVNYDDLHRLRSLIIMEYADRLIFIASDEIDPKEISPELHGDRMVVTVYHEYDSEYDTEYTAGQYTTEGGWKYIDVEVEYVG